MCMGYMALIILRFYQADLLVVVQLIFWRASKFACVEIVATNSRRVCAVRICCDT